MLIQGANLRFVYESERKFFLEFEGLGTVQMERKDIINALKKCVFDYNPDNNYVTVRLLYSYTTFEESVLCDTDDYPDNFLEDEDEYPIEISEEEEMERRARPRGMSQPTIISTACSTTNSSL